MNKMLLFLALLFQSQTKVDQSQLPLSLSGLFAPTITVTVVSATTPNSFPLPAGKTTCIVSRNVAQSPGVDYNIATGAQSGSTFAVVFIQTPEVGDVVQLNCW
jgi:hypothetical protein